MHKFIASENSCFFDICLPNYTPQSHLRKITYFKDISPLTEATEELDLSQAVFQKNKSVITDISYDTTPPRMPVNFKVNDLSYRGVMN
jgi:PCO_ADO